MLYFLKDQAMATYFFFELLCILVLHHENARNTQSKAIHVSQIFPAEHASTPPPQTFTSSLLTRTPPVPPRKLLVLPYVHDMVLVVPAVYVHVIGIEKKEGKQKQCNFTRVWAPIDKIPVEHIRVIRRR